MAKRGRKPAPGIQKELIKGARQKKAIPKALQDLLEPCAEAIYNAATYKVQENEFKDQIRELMVKHKINDIELPNKGRLVYKPGKSSVTYIAPKAAKIQEADDNDDEEEADDDEE